MAEDRDREEPGAVGITKTPDTQRRIHRDRSGMHSVYANIAQVKASQTEFMLLFGTNRARDPNSLEIRAQLDEEIILSPGAAKRFAGLLNAFIQEYESKFGPLDLETPPLTRTARPPLRLPLFKFVETAEEVSLLFRLLKDLNLKVAFERSFKISEKILLGSRFLAAVKKGSIQGNPQDRILDICTRLNMPKIFSDTFQENLTDADAVGFGIEENETSCTVKAYLEFKSRYAEAFKKNPDKPDPYLSHWGLKWDAADNTRSALARYTCFPGLTVEEMLERLSNNLYGQTGRNPFQIVKDLLDLASNKVGRDKFLYLEVNEGNNPRTSFDINIYGANLRMKEVYPFLLEMCGHYSISNRQFHILYDPIKNQTFGHLSGGTDSKGRDFLTVYFGG
jgi:hypothetical protein